MYVYWYSILRSILSNKLGTLNPVTFNYTASLLLAMLFLEFCLEDSPQARPALPASAARAHALDQDSLLPCAWALPAAWLWLCPWPCSPGRAGCCTRGCGNGKWSSVLCICESWLLGSCSQVAVLLSRGAVVVVQLGAGSLVNNTVNLTLSFRQGRRRRKEKTWMGGRTQKEECSKSLWWNYLVLLRRANPSEITQARFA